LNRIGIEKDGGIWLHQIPSPIFSPWGDVSPPPHTFCEGGLGRRWGDGRETGRGRPLFSHRAEGGKPGTGPGKVQKNEELNRAIRWRSVRVTRSGETCNELDDNNGGSNTYVRGKRH